MANKFLLLFSIVFAACGNVTAPHGEDAGAGSDAQGTDAATPDQGPHAHGLSAAGRRTASAHFVLLSVTGQPTPVANGRSTSAHYVHVPGILGGQ